MQEIFYALDLENDITTVGEGSLTSCFAVTDLATTAIGAVGKALSALINELGGYKTAPHVTVDRKLSSLWFASSISPVDWEMPPLWDAIAGDYEAKDGWIKLHTNLPHHRAAALTVLSSSADKSSVATAIKNWGVDDLETAIIENGGVAAAMRSYAAWKKHPQGKAVAVEPLIQWTRIHQRKIRNFTTVADRPLSGLRVLDLTRVLAGPVATRTLAGFGANVLRIDPFGWDEPNIVPDVTLGKRCCRLNLHDQEARVTFKKLLQSADILVHGYRPGALEQLGYTEAVRRQISPDLIEVTLDAYGWTGPWATRRGFDSLVQMSCGIAHAGMDWAGSNQPTPLPVQALDHATGYLMAAAVIRAVLNAVRGEGVSCAKLSLARTAELLLKKPHNNSRAMPLSPSSSDYCDHKESTPWGKALLLKAPLHIEGAPMRWSRPACELGSDDPHWG